MSDCPSEHHTLDAIPLRLLAAFLIAFLPGCQDSEPSSPAGSAQEGELKSAEGTVPVEWKTITADEWSSRLTAEEFTHLS